MRNDAELQAGRTVAGATCLITGAGGFIGSHLAEELVRQGAVVRALVHYNALGSRGWLDESDLCERMDVFAGDITDRDSIGGAFDGVDYVFHLAALIPIPYSYIAPESFVRTNVLGTLNILQLARSSGVRRVIQTSTSEVYGTARCVPMSESHPLQAQSPYAASKIGADKMAEAVGLSFDLPVVTVRPFNTYGPRQSGRAVIPTIVTQCLEGDVVRVGSVHPTRDFNFVVDTIRGFIRAAVADEASGRTINLGSGREISVGDLARLVGELTGRDIEIVSEDERRRPADSEVDQLCADNSLARDVLGWSPEVSLREGLQRTIDWFRENLHRYNAGVYQT